MRGLLQFIYRYRVLEFFIFLEVICVWLIVQNNRYHNVDFLSSSNAAVSGVNQFTSNTERYFELDQINNELAKENAKLRSELARYVYNNNYLSNSNDSLLNRYLVTSAKVIKNNVSKADNYFTIDKGENHGLSQGMGVINSDGVLGQVKNITNNFSTVTSLLHSDLMISSMLKKNNTFCSVQWDGIDPQYTKVRYLPRHLNVILGDTVVTSGFNSVYPEGIMIGIVSEVDLKENESFLDVTVKLAANFRTLDYVYITYDSMVQELDSLNNLTNP